MDNINEADRLVRAFAAQLRAERAVSGMTLDALAEAAGVSRRALVNYLDGTRTASMGLAAMTAIASALGTDPATLWRRAAERV